METFLWALVTRFVEVSRIEVPLAGYEDLRCPVWAEDNVLVEGAGAYAWAVEAVHGDGDEG